jgi:hypothetical protein
LPVSPHQQHAIQVASNLLLAGWSNLATHLPATAPMNTCTDSVAVPSPRLYRVHRD